jgi:hypothetical protein
MTKLRPKDMIAIILLVCWTFLIFNEINNPFNDIIGLVVGYYFGHRTTGVDTGH